MVAVLVKFRMPLIFFHYLTLALGFSLAHTVCPARAREALLLFMLGGNSFSSFPVHFYRKNSWNKLRMFQVQWEAP